MMSQLRLPVGLVAAVVTTNIAAQIATLPFAVGAFGQVPLLALPANLIVAPLAQSRLCCQRAPGCRRRHGLVIPWIDDRSENCSLPAPPSRPG